MFQPITIPKEYWLDVNKFDYTKFDYDDIRCIYNSPRTLIEDFENVIGFKQYVRTVINKYKPQLKKKNIHAPKYYIEKKNKNVNTNIGTKLVDITKNILINLSLLKNNNKDS